MTELSVIRLVKLELSPFVPVAIQNEFFTLRDNSMSPSIRHLYR